MSPAVLIAEAWNSLRFFARRSMLTMLGISWGIATLVMLISYGTEMEKVVRAGFDAWGTKLLIVWGGRTSEQAGGERVGRPIRLTLDDMQFVQANIPLVRNASPECERRLALAYGTRSQEFDVKGVYPIYGAMRGMQPEQGRWLDEADEVGRARVVVIGADVRRRLFSERPALNESVRIAGMSFTVVGVLHPKVGVAGEEDNRLAFIPFSTMVLFRSTRWIDSFYVELEAGEGNADAVKQIRARLAERLVFRPTDERALQIWNAEAEFAEIRLIMSMLRVMVAIIGVITLGVGGVGVTNIMLVAVTQRTREIGIQRAVGARRSQILAQFLAEALLITFAGGLLGLVFAYLVIWIVPPLPVWSVFSDQVTPGSDVALRIDWLTLLQATGILSGVGLVAGLWPAVRASRLRPVDALRYE